MIQKLIAPLVVLLILSSCGAGKKLEAANAQIDQLQASNKTLTSNVSALKGQVADLTGNNANLTSQLSSCQTNAQATAQKLQTTQQIINEERKKMFEVEKKLDDAMTDFENKGVNIYLKNGYVYVSMAENLLYKSGSAALSDSGKQALAHLAKVLNGYPKLDVIVLGNTDTVQFKKGKDNWDLSTERANGVVRVLRDASVNPSRLTSAGKGKYNPIADNSTAEGRAKNRRTDIILNPDMERIWESVDK